MLTKQQVNPELANLVAAFRGSEREQVPIHYSGGIWKEWKEQGYICNPYNNLDNQPKPGYVIVKFDTQEVHAETRLLEYLMVTGVIDKLKENQSPLYIAISKKCCVGCDKFLQAVAESYEIKIDYKGTHGRQPTWEPPVILNNEDDRVTHSYVVIDEKTKKPHLEYVKEDKNPPKDTEVYPYCYIEDKIIQPLKTKCPPLKADPNIGEKHLAEHSGDELTPPTASPVNILDTSGEAKIDSLMNELLTEISLKDTLSEKQLEFLGKIMSQASNKRTEKEEQSLQQQVVNSPRILQVPATIKEPQETSKNKESQKIADTGKKRPPEPTPTSSTTSHSNKIVKNNGNQTIHNTTRSQAAEIGNVINTSGQSQSENTKKSSTKTPPAHTKEGNYRG